jgi:hypothetical protein
LKITCFVEKDFWITHVGKCSSVSVTALFTELRIQGDSKVWRSYLVKEINLGERINDAALLDL